MEYQFVTIKSIWIPNRTRVFNARVILILQTFKKKLVTLKINSTSSHLMTRKSCNSSFKSKPQTPNSGLHPATSSSVVLLAVV